MKTNDSLRSLILRLISDGHIKSQEDLAVKISVSKGYISQMVMGKRAISNKMVETLCNKYPFINSGFLLNRDVEMFNSVEYNISSEWVHFEKSEVNKSLSLTFNVGFQVDIKMAPDGSIITTGKRKIHGKMIPVFQTILYITPKKL